MKKHQQQPETKRDDRGLFFRSVEMTATGEGEDITLAASVSSELPVLTYGRVGDQWLTFWEVLDHAPASIDMSRCSNGLVILDRHNGDQVGLIRKPAAEDGKLGGKIEFCSGERACEIAADAKKGLRCNMSVGYAPDPAAYTIEGTKDGYPLARCRRWTPLEASFEPVPADPRVGVGRELKVTTTGGDAPEKERKMRTAKEIAAMFERGAKFGIDAAKVAEMVESENGERELDAAIIERQQADLVSVRAEQDKAKQRAAGTTAIPPIGAGATAVPEKELRQYSVNNVIRSLIGAGGDIGREREISQQLAKERGKPASGIIIPHSVLASRALTVAGTASATVQTTVDSANFIDLVRTTSILGDLGVRFMTGVVGNIAYPKMTGGATGYWVAENGAITGSTPTLGQVQGTPHTCGALVDLSRLMLNQSTPDAEMFTRNEIIERIARTIQIALFAGTGEDGQPSGITTATGIANPSVTAGTPTYAELLAFVGSILTNNNSAAQGMKWAMTGAVWAKLAATPTNGAGSPLALDPNSRTMAGFGYVSPCEDLPAKSLWFGDWTTVMVPIWGNGVDLIVDTSTLSAQGGLRLVGLQDVDFCVRNGKALAYNLAVLS